MKIIAQKLSQRYSQTLKKLSQVIQNKRRGKLSATQCFETNAELHACEVADFYNELPEKRLSWCDKFLNLNGEYIEK